MRILSVLLVATLAGCADESSRLSFDETVACARVRFKGHPGTFSLVGKTIAYSLETPNGVGRVIVIFNEKRRPEETFFESTPLGTHEELMDAAQAIKECAEYGRKARAARPDSAGLHSSLKVPRGVVRHSSRASCTASSRSIAASERKVITRERGTAPTVGSTFVRRWHQLEELGHDRQI